MKRERIADLRRQRRNEIKAEREARFKSRVYEEIASKAHFRAICLALEIEALGGKVKR